MEKKTCPITGVDLVAHPNGYWFVCPNCEPQMFQQVPELPDVGDRRRAEND